MKAKTAFIVVAVTLSLIIVGQAFYLYQQHSSLEILRGEYSLLQEDYAALQEDYNALEGRYASLEEDYKILESEYGALERDYEVLEGRYASLESEHSSLQEDYQTLKQDHEVLQKEHETLQKDYEVLQSEFSELNSDYKALKSKLAEAEAKISNLRLEIQRLQRIAEENKFMFYYASFAEQRYGVEDLEEYLDRWEWSEGAYVEDVFDCSEMSAYIEWRLENEGYHTYIVCGEAPWGGGDHVWLLVETSPEHYMPVEATTYDLVKWDDPYFDNYFEYDLIFEDIQEALEYDYEEFDWWAS